jgi:hypothetical protein
MQPQENPVAEIPEPAVTESAFEVSPGILKARALLRADLTALLADRRSRGKWACYSSEGRVGIGNDHLALIRECVRRDIPDNAFIIERVEPGAGSDEEVEVESRY